MAQPKIMVEFEDKYGERRVIHRNNRGRMMLKRLRRTVVHVLGPIIGLQVGTEIRKQRRALGLGPDELLQRAGLIAADSRQKQRMYEIEKGGGRRKQGIRLGTLYALSEALGIEARDLLPSNADVFGQCDVALAERVHEGVCVNGDAYQGIDPSIERMDID